MSYSVGRRTSEIGIRLALGGPRRRVLAMVVGEILTLVAAGLAIGVPATMAASRVMAAQLFGVDTADPLTRRWFPPRGVRAWIRWPR